MNVTTLIVATSLIGAALLALPLGEFSPVGEASASVCLSSDDPVQDVKCQTRCAPDSVDEIFDPQACPL